MNDYDKKYLSDSVYAAESDKRRVNKEIRKLEGSILSHCKTLASLGQKLNELETTRSHCEWQIRELKGENS